MKLALFGSTCTIGKILVKKALERGHEVNVLVRNPEKLGDLKNRIRIIHGNYSNEKDLENTISGINAILSAIGPSMRKSEENKPEHYEIGLKNVIRIMEKEGIDQITVILGAGIKMPNENVSFSRKLLRFMMAVIARHILETKQKELAVLMNSNVKWTAVRPPSITEANGIFKADENKLAGMKVDITQLADFMLDSLENNTWNQKAPFLTNSMLSIKDSIPNGKSLLKYSDPTVSSREISASFCNRIGPVSIPLSGQKMVIPVLVSPLIMAQLMALPPRCLGSNEGWYWIVPNLG